MKIIDEKGRLFGKINVIDFFVILFLFCLAPMFYFGFKIFTKKPVPVQEEKRDFVDIEILCNFIRLMSEDAKLVAIGDKEVDENGALMGQIIWLGEVKPYKHKFDIGIGNVQTIEDSTLKELPVRLKLNVETKDGSVYYKDKKITLDSPIDFKTEKYTLIALPILALALETKKMQTVTRNIDLYVILKLFDEDTLKLVSVGDKELDEKGNLVAEILNIGKIENDSYEIDLGGGNFVLGEDANRKQVSVKMRLRCKIQDNKQLYFKGNLVASNSFIEFKTNKYTATGRISKAYEATPILPKEKWLQLQVKFSGVIPELAKVITEGDAEKDVKGGSILSKLKSIVVNKFSDVMVIRDNTFVTLTHPFQRDIIANIDFLCIEKEGVLYFKNYPVKMGNSITFSSDLYSISGTIIGLEMK